MTFHVTSAYRHALVLGVSAIVHGAAFFAPRPHAGGTADAASQPPTIDIQVEPALPPDALDTLDDTPSANRGPPVSMRSHLRAVHAPPPAPRVDAPIPGEASAAVATNGAMPHFALAVATQPVATQAVATQAVASQPSGARGPGHLAPGAEPAPSGPVDDSTPLSEQGVDIPARLVESEVPTYPADARAEGVEADVRLEIVVSREGSVESVRAVRSNGYGLDDAATRAARRFRFAPAVKYGRPVRVRVSWTVQFRLR